MYTYRLAGNTFSLSIPSTELAPYRVEVGKQASWENPSPVSGAILSCNSVGWLAGAQRRIETWLAPPRILLKVEGGSDFYITPDGQISAMSYMEQEKGNGSKNKTFSSPIDNETLLGPALVLSLAMRGTLSLHASAATYNGKNIAFVGESGQGKSTLAAYLDKNGWQRIADDILPITSGTTGIQAWPRFPQLKLPPDQQPGFNFPENIPLHSVCFLAEAEKHAPPAIELYSPAQAVQVMISHTAGTRLFWPELLQKHIDFCAETAKNIPVYQLDYPHRREALPEIKDLLETLC